MAKCWNFNLPTFLRSLWRRKSCLGIHRITVHFKYLSLILNIITFLAGRRYLSKSIKTAIALILVVRVLSYIFVIFTQTWKNLSHFRHIGGGKIHAICIGNRGPKITILVSLILIILHHKLRAQVYGSSSCMINLGFRIKVKRPYVLIFRTCSLRMIEFYRRSKRLWTKHNHPISSLFFILLILV